MRDALTGLAGPRGHVSVSNMLDVPRILIHARMACVFGKQVTAFRKVCAQEVNILLHVKMVAAGIRLADAGIIS